MQTAAAAEGVPLSTAYRWVANADGEGIEALQIERAFFTSPVGLRVLHRIVGAVHLALVQAGGCGADRVCEFLMLSQLDAFVAASHGKQHGTVSRVTQLLGEYGDEQRVRLGALMAAKRIVVCEDETFHLATCLVAIDAESGLILVERYAPKRDGATWTAALATALGDMPVEVIRVVGDEAKGLIHHARKGLGVEHGADLFHIQHDLSAATALPLKRRLTGPRQRLEDAETVTKTWRDNQAEYVRGPRSPGRPLDYDRRIAESLAVETERQAVLDAALADQAAVRAAIRELGDAYHPVDLETGAIQSVETLRTRLDAAMASIDGVAQRIRLPERARERIDKARRVLPKLLAGLAFFHGELERALSTLDLAPAVLAIVRTELLPGLYLARAAKLDKAFAAHPTRFTHGRPLAPSPPTEVWINQPALEFTDAAEPEATNPSPHDSDPAVARDAPTQAHSPDAQAGSTAAEGRAQRSVDAGEHPATLADSVSTQTPRRMVPRPVAVH